MAYTYEQFQTAASEAGLLDKFDKQDLVVAQSNPEYGISMLQLMKNRSSAKTTEQQALADAAVRQLRSTYSGYSSGGRLPEYADEVIQQTENYYAGQNAYRKALAEAEGYANQKYNETVGDIYERQNPLERERARADALAIASARTGGRPSSAAIAAAQQTAGEYDAQLDETILGLRKNAYQQALKAAGDGSSDGLTEEQKKANAKALADYIKTAPEAALQALGKVPGLDKLYNSVVAPVQNAVSDAWNRITAPSPEETDAVKARAQSIDGNIRIMQMSGASKNEIRERLLEYFNNDGFVGSLSDGEWAWLLKHYEQYDLLNGGT